MFLLAPRSAFSVQSSGKMQRCATPFPPPVCSARLSSSSCSRRLTILQPARSMAGAAADAAGLLPDPSGVQAWAPCADDQHSDDAAALLRPLLLPALKWLCPSLILSAALSAAQPHGILVVGGVLALGVASVAATWGAPSQEEHHQQLQLQAVSSSSPDVGHARIARAVLTVALPTLLALALAQPAHGASSGALTMTATLPPAFLPLPVLCAFACLNACCLSILEDLRAALSQPRGPTHQVHHQEQQLQQQPLCARLGCCEAKCLLMLACLANVGMCALSGRLEMALLPGAIAVAAALTRAQTSFRRHEPRLAATAAAAESGLAAAAREGRQREEVLAADVARRVGDMAMASSMLACGVAALGLSGACLPVSD